MALRDSHDPLETVEMLAARAREELAPRVDVSQDVLRRLRAPERKPDRGLLFLTAGALAAASIVLAISYPSFTEVFDPLASLMETTATSLI